MLQSRCASPLASGIAAGRYERGCGVVLPRRKVRCFGRREALDVTQGYTGRAVSEVTSCSWLETISRNYWSPVRRSPGGGCPAWHSGWVACQARLLALLGGSLAAQAASLLAEEAVDGRVELPQRTLAAMLGVARPSLNKVLKDLERDGLIKINYSAIGVLGRAGLIGRT